jgi:hypothetical protein
MLVDSYFWNKSLLWPEFSGIYFNVIQGKSAEWGVIVVFPAFPLRFAKSFFPFLDFTQTHIYHLVSTQTSSRSSTTIACWIFYRPTNSDDDDTPHRLYCIDKLPWT